MKRVFSAIMSAVIAVSCIPSVFADDTLYAPPDDGYIEIEETVSSENIERPALSGSIIDTIEARLGESVEDKFGSEIYQSLLDGSILEAAEIEPEHEYEDFSENISPDRALTGTGKLFVIMHHEYSDIGKDFYPDDFPELDVESVRNISIADETNSTREDFAGRWEEFRNTVEITLIDKSDANVRSAIEKLEARSTLDIYSVMPDCDMSDIEVEVCAVPNDTLYSANQSAYANLVGLPTAWNITKGSRSTKIAMMEPFGSHADLNANFSNGKDFATGNTITVNNSFTSGHGYVCAGVVGAKGNNGIGVAGVCWDVSVIPFNLNGFTPSGFSTFFKYLNDNNIKVASCSIIGTVTDKTTISAFESAVSEYKGLLVCAAGNDNINTDTASVTRIPGDLSCKNVITVGGCTASDTKWSGSNYGAKTVDLFAPAEKVYTVNINGGYGGATGTSMAAPYVAGILGLMMTANTNLDAISAKAILLNTVTRSSEYIGKCVSGGRVNAAAAVTAAKNSTNNEFLFDAQNKTIEGYSGKSTYTQITIPRTINGVTVQKIGKRAFSSDSADSNTKKITKVTLPSSITHIGESAFEGCVKLTSINLPSSVSQIEKAAFMGATALTSINIPGSVQMISASAFEGCTSLASVTLNEGSTALLSKSFKDDTSLTSISLPSSMTILMASVFEGCTALKSANLGSVTVLGGANFRGCTSLESVALPSTLEGIGTSVFEGCTALESVTGGLGLTGINQSAFKNCSSLESISLPNAVTEIKPYTFSGCTSLSYVHIGNAVTAIGDYAFSKCAMQNITLPSTLTTIGDHAFWACKELRRIAAPNSVTNIDDSAFMACTNLASVSLPSRLQEIGYNCFMSCRSLASITIPAGVTKIGTAAFRNCSSLKSISIPSAVTSLGRYALSNCTSLRTIELPDNITELTTYTFAGSTKAVIYVNCSSDTQLLLDTNEITHCTVDPGRIVRFNKGTNCTVTEVYIPSTLFGDNITHIYGHAFEGVSGLEVITVPETVVNISYKAFKDCSDLVTLSIPSSVNYISNSMSSTIVDGDSKVYIFCMEGSYAAEYAASINANYVTCSQKTSTTCKLNTFASGANEDLKLLRVPDKVGKFKVTEIVSNEFSSHQFGGIDLPETVTTIGTNAFVGGASSTLCDLYIRSTTLTLRNTMFTGTPQNFTMHCKKDTPAYYFAETNDLNIAIIND